MNKPLLLERPTQVRYGVLAWFCTLSMITYIDRFCIQTVQGDIRHDLGLSKEQFAWTFAAFGLAYAAFEVPSGWLGDLFGPRKVLTRIVLCWLVFTALTGTVWGLTSLIVVRFLFGAGEAGAYPNMARGAKSWFPFRERGRAQGLIWMFGRWGGAVAPLLTVALTFPFPGWGQNGWRGAFLMLGLLGVLWVIGFYWWFRDTPQEHPGVNDAERALIEESKSSREQPLTEPASTEETAPSTLSSPAAPNPTAPMSWSSILTSPTLWALSVMYFCSNCGWVFYMTWFGDYLKQDLNLSGIVLLLAIGGPLFFGGIACVLGGFFTDRQVRVWGRRWGRTLQGMVAYGVAGLLFLLALATTDTHRGVAFMALCLASFVKDFAMAASWSTTIDIGHRYSGTVAGCMNTIGNLGTVVSPPIVIWLSQENYKPALIYSAAMFLTAAGCWLFINPRRVIVYSPADRERLEAEGVLT